MSGDVRYSPLVGQTFSKPIYHYTSIATYREICASKRLRATDVRFMNDSMELQMALELLESLIDSESAGDEKVALKLLFQWLREDFEAGHSVFALCFSRHGNLLSQWRGYVGDGAGVSFGLDIKGVESLLVNSGITWIARECLYKPEDQLDCMRHVLKQMKGWPAKLVSDGIPLAESESSAKAWLITNAHFIYFCAGLVKHEKFFEESEIRVLSKPIGVNEALTEQIKYRAGKYSLIPYIEFDLEQLAAKTGRPAIVDVIVGPTPHPTSSCLTLRGLQKSQWGDAAPSVTYCEIPYRPNV